ncbi:helix-turn-helix domain-containing protein [Ferrimicrobium sp.]|uniref:helix-turn-helix transcriptional regulator n=1 Tax=Ferrimicrobium sp. TaxID=2926050 RepID=UPI00262DE3E6|nr:helix-turn-helix domain-containing protein [Ferrimicrobium sp.]
METTGPSTKQTRSFTRALATSDQAEPPTTRVSQPTDLGHDHRDANGSLTSSFTGAVQALSQALGDPTRREIYLYVREHGSVTAQEIGRQFQLHPNVARHHLDRLAASGYVEAGVDRDGAPQVGRPSKRYRSTGAPLLVDGIGEQATLLGKLLASALEILDDQTVERLAYEVGLDYGREIGLQMNGQAATKSIAASLKLVADALTRSGFSSRDDSHMDSLGLKNKSCPFGVLVADHPVLCVTESGIIKGLLESLAIDGDLAHAETVRGGTRGCEVRIYPKTETIVTIQPRPGDPG